MTAPQMDFEAWLDAQSALLGLPIAPEHRAGVLRYLQLAAGMAPRVMDFELGSADESGSVFVPVSPRDQRVGAGEQGGRGERSDRGGTA